MRIVTLLGDYYHSHDRLLQFLQTTLSTHQIEDGEVKDLPGILEENPDMILISKENRLTPKDGGASWLTEELDQFIWQYVQKGGRLFVLHSGLSSYPESSLYRKITKGHFLHHPDEHNEVIYRGKDTFSFPDEHYFVAVDEAETEVFLTSSSKEGTSIAGWRHQVEQGRVLCLTPTHTEEGFKNQTFQAYFVECAEWLLAEQTV